MSLFHNYWDYCKILSNQLASSCRFLLACHNIWHPIGTVTLKNDFFFFFCKCNSLCCFPVLWNCCLIKYGSTSLCYIHDSHCIYNFSVLTTNKVHSCFQDTVWYFRKCHLKLTPRIQQIVQHKPPIKPQYVLFTGGFTGFSYLQTELIYSTLCAKLSQRTVSLVKECLPGKNLQLQTYQGHHRRYLNWNQTIDGVIFLSLHTVKLIFTS